MGKYRRELKLEVFMLKKPQLHYAVAIALGLPPIESEEDLSKKKNAVFSDGAYTIALLKGEPLEFDWALAGKIMKKEKISVTARYMDWEAVYFVEPHSESKQCDNRGKTALEAIFKCFVEKKLGRSVLIPNEFD